MSTGSEKIQYRYEQKFVFQQKSIVFVKGIVETHQADFHEIFKERKVNNIYFDTPELDFYSDHKENKAIRLKIRIRWYGDTFGQVLHPILEFKIRDGDLRIKKSYTLPEFNIETGVEAKQLNEVLAKANLPDDIYNEVKDLEARLLNTYKRRYYRSFNSHYRFTIDHKLEFIKFLVHQNPFLNKEIDSDNVILELKFAPEFIKEAYSILENLPIQSNVFSKYVYGMEKLYPLILSNGKEQ